MDTYGLSVVLSALYEPFFLHILRLNYKVSTLTHLFGVFIRYLRA